jgi:signal transduction histidine kinase
VHANETEARVLLLNGTDPNLPANAAIDRAMREALARDSTGHIIYFSESLDAQRFAIEALEPEMLALFVKKYAALRIDVVVAASQSAFEFFMRHGEQLWPGARLVYHGFPGEDVDPRVMPPNAAAVVARLAIGRTINLALRMQPQARRIVVVAGTGDIDRHAEQLTRTALAAHPVQLPVVYLSGLPLPELVARVAQEPADSIVIYLAVFRDRDGRPYVPREVLRAVGSASPAPVYGLAETYFGFGAAAGHVESYAAKGRLVAERVLAALAGAPVDPSRAVVEAPSLCVADARALQRWSMDAARLPEGCDIRFADLPAWRRYWWQIVLAMTVIVAQSLLIAALIVQSRRRRAAELQSKRRYAEMAHMNRRVALGEMSASIAHELNQPLGAIQNNAAAAEMLMQADPPKLHDVMEILRDIKRDDQRASDIVERVRRMLRKTAFELREVDLNDTIAEAVQVLAGEASDRGVVLETELDPELPKVRADRVQLQQVIVNLALNAMEAMHDQPAGRRQLTLCSRRTNNAHAEVSVADTGPGIPEATIGSIFDPFVSGKPDGMGMGLAISRTIVEAHGGAIRAANAPEGGAVLSFDLPPAAGVSPA